jgi:hypothetical protein
MSQRSETEYHHYIPQFLLGRFAVPQPPGRKFHKGQCKANTVDLTTYPPRIKTVLVRKTFGQKDMYKDRLKVTPNEQRYIETKLSEVEQAASHIIARVVLARAKGEDNISLSRTEKDTLRKFLFVMKYRAPIFFARFNHETAQEYESEDRHTFLEYMKAKGFTRPLEVWFDNLKKVIDAPMDPDGYWIMKLMRTIYPPDALWIFMIFRSMHLAFVTPSDPEQEFILTENAFSIHEGPGTTSTDLITGEPKLIAYTEFHLLSIVSPDLAIVLRHNTMPEPLEDANPDICRGKAAELKMQARQHIDPKHATSLLVDLPVAKARNPHIIISNAWLVSGDGAIENPRPDDQFRFTFFRLGSKHTQMINAIMLDQGHHTSSIIFKSAPALRMALDFYLDYPTQAKGGHSMKTISDLQDDPRLLLLQRLEHVAHSLGSQVKARYHVDPLIDAHSALLPDQAVADALKSTRRLIINSALSLPETFLLEVIRLGMIDLKVARAVDRIMVEHNRPSYPEFIYNRVRGVRAAALNEYTRTLPGVSLQVWRSTWDSLFDRLPVAELGSEIESAWERLDCLGVAPVGPQQRAVHMTPDIGESSTEVLSPIPSKKQLNSNSPGQSSGLSRKRLKEAFDLLGCDDDLKGQHAALGASSASNARAKVGELVDDDDAFDTDILQVLRTAKPLSSDTPLTLAMVVMAQVLEKKQMSIMSMYALDTITACDGVPSFPELVFNATRSAGPIDLNQHTQVLPQVELHLWILGWEALVHRAMQQPGADLNHHIDGMRATLRLLGLPISSETPTKLDHRARGYMVAQKFDGTEKPNDGKVARGDDNVHGSDTTPMPSMSRTPRSSPDAECLRVNERGNKPDEYLQSMPQKRQQYVSIHATSTTVTHTTVDEPRLSRKTVLSSLAIVLLGYLVWMYLR